MSGLALGFDMDWAEAVLDAGLTLWVAIPFEGQPARWPKAQQARWARLRKAAARERIVGTVPDTIEPRQRSAAVNRLMFKRNTTMLDVTGAVVTVWEPGRLDGGTTGALLEANKRGMPGVHLDPVNQRVHFQLPTRADLEAHALHHTRCGHVAFVGTRRDAFDRLAALHTADRPDWKLRPAKPRETWQEGCDTCADDLLAAAVAALGDAIPVNVPV